MDTQQLCAKAIDKWGARAQLLMVAEECSELAVAVLHYERGRDDVGHVAEEVADVELMLEQLRMMLRGKYKGFDGLVEAWKETKWIRLERNLEVK